MAKIASVHSSGNPIGTIVPSSSSQALAGTLLCDGSAISRTTYANLFAVIGTTYGSGGASGGSFVSTPATVTVTGPTVDGTNGTPRTGTETAPAHLGINYCIAYR